MIDAPRDLSWCRDRDEEAWCRKRDAGKSVSRVGYSAIISSKLISPLNRASYGAFSM